MEDEPLIYTLSSAETKAFQDIVDHLKNNNFPNIDNTTYHILVKALNYYNNLYYTKGDSGLQDSEYDMLYNFLLKVEKQNPKFTSPESVTQKVGTNLASNKQVHKHDPPMLSLQNIFSVDTEKNQLDLKTFHKQVCKQLNDIIPLEDIVYHCEPKFDGLALELEYHNGILQGGYTRGDGIVGEEVTNKLTYIQNIPQKLKTNFPPKYISIRGECIMSIQDFQNLNQYKEKNNQKVFSNARSAAVSSINTKDLQNIQDRKITFQPYGYGKIEYNTKHTLSVSNQFQFMQEYLPKIGFIVPVALMKLCSFSQIIDFYNMIYQKRHTIEWDLDGIAIKYNNIIQWEFFEKTAKYPKHTVAFKFPSKTGITVMLSITYQIGRTGIITPVAELSPITIGGVVVKRATLHNSDEIKRLDIRINDSVLVERSGDVIPKITKVILEKRKKSNAKVQFIQKCPSCKSTLQKEKSFYRCVNENCKGVQKEKLQYFVSKSGMDMDGFGDIWIEKFLQLGIVRDIADIMKLEKKDIIGLEGIQEKLANQIITAIESKKKVPFFVFLRSLGILNIGSNTAKIIEESGFTIEQIIKIGEKFENILAKKVKNNVLEIEKTFSNVITTTIQHLQNTKKTNKSKGNVTDTRYGKRNY